jgi:hypothetical protein
MATQTEITAKGRQTQGFNRDTHDCFMDVSDPAVWLDNSMDLVANLRRWVHGKEQPGNFEMRFSEDGDYSLLTVYGNDGYRTMGHMAKEELMPFLRRGLARMDQVLYPDEVIVANLHRMVHSKEQPGNFNLRFYAGGQLSYLAVYSTDGRRCLGHLNREELMPFLSRGLARMEHMTVSNSRSSMQRAAVHGLTVIRGGLA